MAKSNLERAEEWRLKNPSAEKVRRYKLKREVLTHYGGGKCACVRCGFDNIWALSIDHIEPKGFRDGATKQHYSASTVYMKLKKGAYPAGYQTLCMNCQWVKRFENFEHLPPKDRPEEIRWWENDG